jgi:hypothetical protein
MFTNMQILLNSRIWLTACKLEDMQQGGLHFVPSVLAVEIASVQRGCPEGLIHTLLPIPGFESISLICFLPYLSLMTARQPLFCAYNDYRTYNLTKDQEISKYRAFHYEMQ